MVKVKNISKTLRVLYDKGGKRVEIAPGETAEMRVAPEHYAFKVESDTEKKEKKEEQKVERRNE